MKYILIIYTFFTLQIANANNIVDVFLTKSNHCSLTGIVDDNSVDLVISCLSRRKNKRPDGKFYLVVNSGGGYIHSGNRLIKYLKQNQGIPTVTYWAASMALVIVEANPGPRLIVDGGKIMQHRISTGITFQFFDYELFLEEVNRVKLVSDNFHEINLDRTGLDKEFYMSKIKDEWYMNTTESLTHNWMDYKVVAKCSDKLLKTTKKVTVSSFFGDIVIDKSMCPLTRNQK